MRKQLKKIQSYFYSPTPGYPLAALRIVLGIAMLTEAVRLFPFLEELYGQFGYLQAKLIEALTGPAIPGFFLDRGIDSDLYMSGFRLFYFLHIVFILAFTLGFKTRFSVVAVWFCQTILINSGYFSSYGVDRYFQIFTFLMIFMPIGNVWSVDRQRSGRPAPTQTSCTFSLRLLQILLLATYANAGLAKTSGTDWWSGEAIWRVLNSPEFSDLNFLWLAQFPLIAKALCWGTLVIETFYIVGYFVPRIGRYWALSIVLMHLGIAALVGLGLFGLTLAAVNTVVLLLPGLEWRPSFLQSKLNWLFIPHAKVSPYRRS